MSKPKRPDFSPYVRKVADLIKLRDWSIIVKNKAGDSDNVAAEVFIDNYARRATIEIRDCFYDLNRKQQKTIVIHELIHCHLEWMVRAYEDLIPGMKGEQNEGWLELAVNSITDILIDKIPSPRITETDGKTTVR